VQELGPETAVLTVKTRRGGVAAKAGHDLVLGVTSWRAAFDAGEHPSIELTADPHSMFVIEGTGGAFALGDEEYEAIEQTIGEEVLTDGPIEFRSAKVEPTAEGLHVEGELTLEGKRHPIAFELQTTEDGRVRGSATVKQTNWGIKPYSALFGTLKVADEVEVSINAKLPTRRPEDG
jgi:hypothetical protein